MRREGTESDVDILPRRRSILPGRSDEEEVGQNEVGGNHDGERMTCLSCVPCCHGHRGGEELAKLPVFARSFEQLLLARKSSGRVRTLPPLPA